MVTRQRVGVTLGHFQGVWQHRAWYHPSLGRGDREEFPAEIWNFLSITSPLSLLSVHSFVC